MKLVFYFVMAILSFTAIPLFARQGERFGKKRAYLMVLCSALFFFSVFSGSRVFFAEVWLPGGLYAAEIMPNSQSYTFFMTGTGEIRLNVKNTGSLTWYSDAVDSPVFLSWHLLSQTGTIIRFDNPRTPFSRSIAPGESESLIVSLSPTLEGMPVGRYIMEFDLVCENVAWFADRGSAARRVSIEVLP